MPTKTSNDLEIAPGFSVSCWNSLNLDPNKPASIDWNKAVEILDARIRCRFLEPVDRLIAFDDSGSRRRYGFAILAIDFLVMETLQGFRDGVLNHNRMSKKLLTDFFLQWNAFKDCLTANDDAKKLAEQVYVDGRCALHHSGSTKGAFRVGISGPMFAFKKNEEIRINRTCLHENLKREFEAYIDSLRALDNERLRANFKKKMDYVCSLGTALEDC